MNTPINAFKMEITDNNYTAEYVGMAEFELYDENGIKIPLTDNMIEVDSFYNSSYVKSNLIDGNISTKWCNNNTNPSWVLVKFNTPTIVSKVRFYGFGTVVSQAPYTFNFQISKNGIKWENIKNVYQVNTSGLWYETELDYSIKRIAIKNPTTNEYYSLSDKTLIPFPDPSTNNMILHGIEKNKEISLDEPFTKVKYPSYSNEILGNGKVFSSTIQTQFTIKNIKVEQE